MPADFISKFLVFLINVIGITLILVVGMSKTDKKLRYIFTIMILCMFIWVDFAFFARQVEDEKLSLLLIRVAWAVTPLLFVSIYAFITFYLKKKATYISTMLILYPLAAILSIVTLSTELVIHEIYVEASIVKMNYGAMIWMFFLVFIVLSIAIHFLLFLELFDKSLTTKGRSKIILMIIGIFIIFVFNLIFNIVTPVFFGIFHLHEFGDYSIIILLIFVAYATIRYDLFGTRILGSLFLVSFIGSFLFIDTLLLSGSLEQVLIKGIVFVFYLCIAFIVIRSSSKEIEKRMDSEALSDALKNYNNPLELEKNELLKLEIVSKRAKGRGIGRVDALKSIIDDLIEYMTPEKGKNKRTQQTIKYEIVRMIAYEGATESQIMWELGFDVFNRSVEQKVAGDRDPKYSLKNASEYSATSDRSFKRLKKEAIEIMLWKLEKMNSEY